MNFLKSFPDQNKLKTYRSNTEETVAYNGHIHTPYSFSSFDNLQQIISMAKEESIKVLGINDFFVTDGYPEFHELTTKNKIFPLFNIEFIGLLKEEQSKGIRINDPGNPGRTYFSGKGLDYPASFKKEDIAQLNIIREESQQQVKEMINKVNHLLDACCEQKLSYEKIKSSLAKELVRERHIAKAIRLLMEEHTNNEEEKKAFLNTLYGGKTTSCDLQNIVAVENEIRSNLLKKGGAAFVEENDAAFLEIEKIKLIIENAGGIPCYPVLLDDKNGDFTEYEKNYQSLYEKLKEKGVFCVELITLRNSLSELEKFIHFFDEKGFVILLGSEHNTPDLSPLTLNARGEKLSTYVERVGYEGACVVAAHQYLRAEGKEGYKGNKKEMIDLGKAVIQYFLTN